MERIVELDPMDIAFSMRSISPLFSGCGRSVRDTLADILEGRVAAADLPMIAVIARPEGTGSDRPPRHSGKAGTSGKGGKKKGRKKGGDRCEEGESPPATARPASDRFRYFSMNNRRLWVFRRAREAGVLKTVPVRLKPPDVCTRLLDPGKKGSRSFRLDRVCDEAKLDEKIRPQRPAKEEGISGDSEGSSLGKQLENELALDAENGLLPRGASAAAYEPKLARG
mmetsp:Transcript_17286/g.48191  ORF Transcript_17286/g.48191 Transcript_17286/m.48191 type:complete len:225 (+) Transcript_17286:85-759(+)